MFRNDVFRCSHQKVERKYSLSYIKHLQFVGLFRKPNNLEKSSAGKTAMILHVKNKNKLLQILDVCLHFFYILKRKKKAFKIVRGIQDICFRWQPFQQYFECMLKWQLLKLEAWITFFIQDISRDVSFKIFFWYLFFFLSLE